MQHRVIQSERRNVPVSPFVGAMCSIFAETKENEKPALNFIAENPDRLKSHPKRIFHLIRARFKVPYSFNH